MERVALSGRRGSETAAAISLRIVVVDCIIIKPRSWSALSSAGAFEFWYNASIALLSLSI